MRQVERRGVTWTVDDSFSSAEWFWDEWEADRWEPETLDYVDQFVTPGSTFVDIGAWCGPVSLWAARTAETVIAIEPDYVAIESLKFNVSQNATNVFVVEGAINDDTGITYIQERGGFGSSMTHLADDGIEVSCWTLPDLFDAYDIENCSLVKMDIEGAESVVLPHVAPFLAELDIPLLIAMHEPWWQRSLDPSWIDSFKEVIGDPHGWNQVLCIPHRDAVPLSWGHGDDLA